jgi:hypothetical protein
MAYPSFHCSNEQSICINPQLLVYESGRGVNEPRYMPMQTPDDEAIDLDTGTNTDDQPLEAYQISRPYQTPIFDEDAEHESISDCPSPPLDSSLDPEAPVFEPESLLEENYNIRTTGEPGFEPLRPTKSPPTPRIQVSSPNDAPLTSGRGVSGGSGRKSRSQSRQSSPGNRSSSISRPRAQSTSRKTPVIPRALAAKLITALASAPTHPATHVPNSFEDRSAPWTGLHTSYPRPLLGQANPYPSLQHAMAGGPSIHGYRCSHEGCPESTKFWDIKSDRDHHLRKHVPEDQRAHACAQCGRRFHFPKDLKRHRDTHNKSAGVTCLMCGKLYSRPDNLKRHISTVHKDTQRSKPASQMRACSPTPSSATSYVQSPVDVTGHNTPWTLSPLMAKSTPSSKSGHNRHDSVNEPDTVDSHTPSESSLFAQPMFKSYSNGM